MIHRVRDRERRMILLRFHGLNTQGARCVTKKIIYTFLSFSLSRSFSLFTLMLHPPMSFTYVHAYARFKLLDRVKALFERHSISPVARGRGIYL